MEFIDVCKKREATRKFRNEKVSLDIIRKILEVGNLAPTAKNQQPQKIYVVQSIDGLKKIDLASPCRYSAPTVLLICSDKNIAWSKGSDSTYEMDATIVATHLVLAATNYGVDSIWVKMFDKKIIKKEFNLSYNIEPICLISLGYRDESYQGNPLHLVRKELDEYVEYL